MREPEKCIVDYCGYSEPRTKEEVEFEVLGLTHLIKVSEQRIAFLRQSQYLAEFMKDNDIEYGTEKVLDEDS